MIKKGLSVDALKCYFLFLEGYFDESTRPAEDNNFFSISKVCRKVITPRAIKTKETLGKSFLSTNYNTQVKLFNELIKAKLITRESRELEVAKYPKLFANMNLDKRKRTWSKETLQPKAFIVFNVNTIPTKEFIEQEMQPTKAREILAEFLFASENTRSKRHDAERYQDYKKKILRYTDAKLNVKELKEQLNKTLLNIGLHPVSLLPFVSEEDLLAELEQRKKAKAFQKVNMKEWETIVQDALAKFEQRAKRDLRGNTK